MANAASALEAAAIAGPETAIAYHAVRDPKQDFWPDTWAQTHDLRSAMKASAVWYYKEVARRLGPERMRYSVEKFDYGNRDTTGGPGDAKARLFGLNGSLRISATQQADFRRSYTMESCSYLDARAASSSS